MAFFTSICIALWLLVILSPVSAQIRGPHPSDVIPAGGSNLTLPALPEGCTSGSAPELNLTEFGGSFYYYGKYEIRAWAKVCSMSSNVRIRLLRYSEVKTSDGGTVVQTFVESEEIPFNSENIYITVERTCEERQVYIEACVQGKSTRPSCTTSFLQLVPSYIVPEPRLQYRPPIKLILHPGDRAKITTHITNEGENSEGFSNGGHDLTGDHFRLQSVVVSRTGEILFKSSLKLGNSSTAILGSRRRPVTKKYHGAKAFIKYALPSCDKLDSFEARYPTEIVVTRNTRRLLRMDTKPPTFDQPIFPPTPVNGTAIVRVKARNDGGGMLQGGRPTPLTYQWYIRTENFRWWYNTYAEPLQGETKPYLKFENIQCGGFSPSRYGVTGLRQYFVDVCNTYGCRRSKTIDLIFTESSLEGIQKAFCKFV